MKCKQCKIKVEKEKLIVTWIYYFCSHECRNIFSKWYTNIVKPTSTTNKNKIAKFSSQTKALILIRDKQCIISGNPISDYHHAYYGSEAQYDDWRNNPDRWVWLYRDIHHEIHHGTGGLWQSYRAYCKYYLEQKQPLPYNQWKQWEY